MKQTEYIHNHTWTNTLLHSYVSYVCFILPYYILQLLQYSVVVSAHQMYVQATGRPVAKGKSVEMEAQIMVRADS